MFLYSIPLRWGAGGDFAVPETEDEAFLSEVKELVMTRRRLGRVGGEIPWDQGFGTGLEFYRHAKETVDPAELTSDLQEVFQTYLTSGRIRSVSVRSGNGVLLVDLQYGRDKTLTLTVPAGS